MFLCSIKIHVMTPAGVDTGYFFFFCRGQHYFELTRSPPPPKKKQSWPFLPFPGDGGGGGGGAEAFTKHINTYKRVIIYFAPPPPPGSANGLTRTNQINSRMVYIVKEKKTSETLKFFNVINSQLSSNNQILTLAIIQSIGSLYFHTS